MKRRSFLQASAAGLALAAMRINANALITQKPKRIGLIGCGWYGKCALFRLLQVADVDVVAICDVDKHMLNQAAELIAARQTSRKKPQTFTDYRQMLKHEKFDIVQVSTPDHWHALAAIAAIQAGADVFVEKPVCVDITEGRAMLAAARKYNRIVQVNTQRRSTHHIIDARDRIIRQNKLGKIGLVEIYSYYHNRTNKNPPDTTPPEYLDYEMWTGPAPMRPYNPLIHPIRWRSFMEYGNGILGDMGIHMLDMARWMLDLDWPKHIASTGGIFVQKNSKANIADTQTATFDFPDLTITWQHRTWDTPPDPDYPWGATFHGDKGTLKVSVHRYDYFPKSKKEKPIHQDVIYELDRYPQDKTEKGLERHVAPALREHWKNFLLAVDTRQKPIADIEQGYISSACCILANIAMKLNRTLTWDPQHQCILNDPQANQLLARQYRSPWLHPTPESI